MEFANISLAGPNHGLEQLVAYPELKQAVRHEHIAGAATEVFAYADLLVTYPHESIASHPSADPLLTIALGPRGLLRHRDLLGRRAVRNDPSGRDLGTQ